MSQNGYVNKILETIFQKIYWDSIKKDKEETPAPLLPRANVVSIGIQTHGCEHYLTCPDLNIGPGGGGGLNKKFSTSVIWQKVFL